MSLIQFKSEWSECKIRCESTWGHWKVFRCFISSTVRVMCSCTMCCINTYCILFNIYVCKFMWVNVGLIKVKEQLSGQKNVGIVRLCEPQIVIIIVYRPNQKYVSYQPQISFFGNIKINVCRSQNRNMLRVFGLQKRTKIFLPGDWAARSSVRVLITLINV